MNESKRFWNKVKKTSSCWIWTAYIKPRGYGLFWLDGRMQRAHRVSYVMAYGAILDGADVLHKLRCSNRSCVRPSHLYLGTHLDNMRDRKAQNHYDTIPKGEKQWQAKVTEENVRAIRKDPRSQRTIAKDFSVAQSTIGCIKRRDTWRHIS